LWPDVRGTLALKESRAARMACLEALAKSRSLLSKNLELRCELREMVDSYLRLAFTAIGPIDNGPRPTP
jgi:hypothetical protein